MHSRSPSATSSARSPAVKTRLLSRTNSSPEPGTWNNHYAVAYLLDHLRTLPAPLSSPKQTAITVSPSIPSPGEAIAAARSFPVSPHAWRLYPSLIFASLGVSVFDGLLDERVVKLMWTSLDRQVSGRTVVIGGPERSEENGGAVGARKEGNLKTKVKIELNAVALQGANRDEIVGTLLHHMIHAYLVVVCESVGTYSCYHDSDLEDGEGGSSDGARQGDSRCGQDEDCLAHGNAFAAILWEIRAQAAKCEADSERPLPIGFGHRLPRAFPQCMGDPSHRFTESSRRINHANKCGANSTKSNKPSSIASPAFNGHPRNSTHCPISVPVITFDSVSSWYAAECAPFLTAPPCMRGSDLYAYSSKKGRLYPIPRDTTSRPASAYVAFVYDGDKPIGVPHAAIERFASLRVDVFAGGRRWVELPDAGVGKEELSALMAFLKSETYRPVVRLRAGTGADQGGCEETKGGTCLSGCDAPVIDTEVRTRRRRRRKAQGARTNAQGIGSESGDEDDDGGDCHGHEACAHHLHDIRVYHFARAIGFSELVTYAIRRLYAHHTLPSDEDPIELLEAIYFPDNGKEVQPPQQLRSWARAFLSRREHGSGMVSNMTKLQTRSQWKKRWHALLARGGEQGRSLLEDVRAAYMQDDAAKRQQRWGRPRQPQGMQYVGYHQGREPWYTQDPAVESPGESSASTDESSHGDDSSADANRRWPNDQFDYAPKNEQGLSPQSPPVQYNGYAPRFPGWWNSQNYVSPYMYSYPFSLSSPPAPLFQYYVATPPYESPHQQVQPQPQSRCKDSAPHSGDAAADTATTMSSVPTKGAANRCKAAAKGNDENERQRKTTRNHGSDGTGRQKVQTRLNEEWGGGMPPQRRRRSTATQRLW